MKRKKKGCPPGTAEILMQGERVPELLSACVAGGIRLENICPQKNGIAAAVAGRDFASLQKSCDHFGMKLSRINGKQAERAWKKYRTRIGLLLGPLLFLMLVKVFSGWIWSVQFVNLSDAQQAAVRQILVQCRQCEGNRVDQGLLREAERQSMSDTGQFGWISLNFSGGRLVVEATEREQAPSAELPQKENLVAVTDAEVISAEVKSGTLLVRPGQMVSVGDVLIQNQKPDHEGNPVEQAVGGTVIGQFRVQYQAEQDKVYTALMPTGAVTVRRKYRFLNWEWPQKNWQTDKIRQEGVTLLGMPLPVSRYTYINAERKNQTITLTVSAAEVFARYRCLCALYAQYPDAKIEKEEAKEEWTGNKLRYTWSATVRANIADRDSRAD